MKMKFFLYVVVVLCAGMLCACEKKQEAEEKAVVQEQTGESSSQDPDAMVASVDGQVITAAEVETELENLLARFGGRVPSEQLKELEPRMREQAVENLITKRLVLEEAERLNIKPTEEQIEAQIATVRSQFPSSEAFYEQLKTMDVDDEKLHRDIGQHVKFKGVFEHATASVAQVTDEDIKKFYGENTESFKVAEQVRASHILCKVEQDASEETRALKKKELEDVRARILAGADFGELAAEHSDCPSKERGGDLGLFVRGRMVKEFEDAAFQLAPGEISPVVETQFGYHVIKVTEHNDPQTVPLEKVRQEIHEHLKNSRQEEAFESFLQKLREKAQIEYARN